MRRDARQHSFAPSEPLETPVTPETLKSEVRGWAERLDVAPTEVRLTGMSRKWASCSTRGRVTFATDLLAQPEPFRREVIVHELLHLKVPNHGPLFRALLSAHLSEVRDRPVQRR
jgi:predicted metal-dependent hydrolase